MKIAFAMAVLATGLLLAAGDSQVDTGKKILDLRNERIDTLKVLVEATTDEQQHNPQRTSRDEVWQARVMLINAELESCETVTNDLRTARVWLSC